MEENCQTGNIPPLEPCVSENSYTPPLTEYEIHIKFLNRGCVVNVGCKSIAFENTNEMVRELDEYVNRHDVCYKKWRKLL